MPPLSIMIKPVSGACDMRCRYCFYADVARHRETQSFGTMSPDTLEALVRRAFLYADGEVSFAFQGGEPTLAGLPFYRTFERLIEKYNPRRLPVHKAIQTNGLSLTDEWAVFLKEAGYLTGVSLDGLRLLHDENRLDAKGEPTFDRARAGIEALRRHDAPFNILCVVTKAAAARGREIFQSLREYGFMQFIPCIDSFDASRPAPWSLSAAEYGQFLCDLFGEYEKAWKEGKPASVRTLDNYLQMLLGYPPESCGMNGRCGVYYLIEADGGVYPCDFYVLDEWKMGNIREDSFKKLEKSPVGARFREMSEKKNEKCLHCPYLALCRGGCRRDREPLDGENISRFCEGYARFFAYALPRMEKMALALGSRR